MRFNLKYLLTASTLAARVFSLDTVEEDYTVTVTKTRRVSSPCLQYQASKALSGNTEGLETGIQIVFVLEDPTNQGISNDPYNPGSQVNDPDYQGIQPDPPSSNKYITTTMCSNRACNVYTINNDDPTYDPTYFATPSVKTAKTTSSTIFKATFTPSPTISKQTTLESITSTKSKPVASQTVVSESKSVTIDTSSITNPVTLSSSTSASYFNSSSRSLQPAYSNSTILITSVHPINSTTLITNTTTITSKLYTNSTTLTKTLVSEFSSLSTVSASTTVINSSSTTEASSSTTSTSSLSTASQPTSATCYSGDIFEVISTSDPKSLFLAQELPLAIPAGVSNEGVPIGTNKFYSNLFLGSQTDMVWTYPYGMYWSTTNYYGFGVQHTNISARIFGSQNTNNVGVPSYYGNPTNVGELIFSATSFDENALYMGVSNMRSLSALVTLTSTQNDKQNYLDIPLVEGIGFVTGIYNGNLVAELDSMNGVESLVLETSAALSPNIIKYRATLFNGVQWLIYITLPQVDASFKLEVKDFYHLQANKNVNGLVIQITVAPSVDTQDSYYDAAAGMYATTADVEGSVSCDSNAQYSIVYETSGISSSGKPIIFALPHHLESLTSAVTSQDTGITIASTTKGNMVGFLTNKLVFAETIDINIQFLPWSQTMTEKLQYTTSQLQLFAKAANDELAVNIPDTVKNMDSNYFSGKVIDKYAYILLVVNDIIQDKEVTQDTLQAMKDAFATFISNKQYYPLMYDTRYGGVTSTSAQNGDTGADFGSAYYNDHHFHYGYFIHAAAIVGYVDKQLNGTWAEDNKEWVNALVRDVANPSEQDNYFPVSRMFDWYHGHSWAAGLFASGDGKNQESSSEDINFAYGMKLWGNVIGDHSMEARGGLMLSIMSRAFNLYFYYKSDNTVQPQSFLPNKVSGIFFENKVDYTTYFGTPDTHPEYVHGIHMLPITPASSLIRISSYVQEEWQDQVSTFVDNVKDGWAGILRLNQALFDPNSSYNFFASDSFTNDYLDNGQSRTWSLAFSAGVLNSS